MHFPLVAALFLIASVEAHAWTEGLVEVVVSRFNMHFPLVAALSFLASVEAHVWTEGLVEEGKLVRTKEVSVSNYTWTVTNWNAGCADDGCSYDFNVSAVAFKASVPAFSAYCSGGGEGAAFDQCEITDTESEKHLVSARLQGVNTTGTGAHLAVSYEFVDPTAKDTYWNYTAYTVEPYNQFASAALTFTMTPTEVWGAA